MSLGLLLCIRARGVLEFRASFAGLRVWCLGFQGRGVTGPGSPVVPPFCPFCFFGFPVVKPSSRKKGTLVMKGPLESLEGKKLLVYDFGG